MNNEPNKPAEANELTEKELEGIAGGVKGAGAANVAEYALGGGRFFAVRIRGGTVFTSGD